jgi:translation initiation factor IF-1
VANDARVELEGTVLAVLPRALYRVAIEGGREIQAHAASGPGVNFIRLIVGDRVMVTLSPNDYTRGRVTRRLPKGRT